MIDAQDIADELIAAEREHKAIGQFSDNHPDFDLDTAYRAQRVFVQSKLDAGERFVGYKLGLTSRNKQQAMGVDAPLYGRVTSGMLCAYGEPVRLDRFIHPRVESEIAFLLARDIEPPATVISVLAATDVVFGAVDVLDSRYEGFKFTLTDVVADNASAGAFYLGPVARRPGELEDLRLLGCVVRVDGEVVMTAAGAAVMGHPAASVAWLANQLAAEGEGLQGRAAGLLRRGHRSGARGGRRQRHLRVRWAGVHRGGRRLTSWGRGMVLQSTAVVTTDAPERYAKQLLPHLGRKNTVETVEGERQRGRLAGQPSTSYYGPSSSGELTGYRRLFGTFHSRSTGTCVGCIGSASPCRVRSRNWPFFWCASPGSARIRQFQQMDTEGFIIVACRIGCWSPRRKPPSGSAYRSGRSNAWSRPAGCLRSTWSAWRAFALSDLEAYVNSLAENRLPTPTQGITMVGRDRRSFAVSMRPDSEAPGVQAPRSGQVDGDVTPHDDVGRSRRLRGGRGN